MASIGFSRIAVEAVPADVVYAGCSLGMLPAQMLTQTRPGAKEALLFHSCVPASEFGGPWPGGVPLQIHAMEDDELSSRRGSRRRAGDRRCGRGAELFLYPGTGHLFADSSLSDFDGDAAVLLVQRVLGFLDGIG